MSDPGPLDALLRAVARSGIAPDADHVADFLWLARRYLPPTDAATSTEASASASTDATQGAAAEAERGAGRASATSSTEGAKAQGGDRDGAWLGRRGEGIAMRVPQAPTIPHEREIRRALRPLARRVPSTTTMDLDETLTAETIAQSGLWVPVLRPTATRWLDVSLVVDHARSMPLWLDVARDLLRLLQYHGAFRDVRVWTVDSSSAGFEPVLREGLQQNGVVRRWEEFCDPRKRRVTLVFSDCVSPGWHGGQMNPLLWRMATNGPTAIIQALPEPLWQRTALRHFADDSFRGVSPGAPNAQLRPQLREALRARSRLGRSSSAPRLPVAVLTLDGPSVSSWVGSVVAAPSNRVRGVLVPPQARPLPTEESVVAVAPDPSADERLRRFLGGSVSSTALRLARRLAAVPLTPPVMRLVMATAVPEATQAHLAEVLFGGIVRQTRSLEEAGGVVDDMEYEFFEGLRERLLPDVPVAETVHLLAKIGEYIDRRHGVASGFSAVLRGDDGAVGRPPDGAFARVSMATLRLLGGHYDGLASRIERAGEGTTDRTDGRRDERPASAEGAAIRPEVPTRPVAPRRGDGAGGRPTRGGEEVGESSSRRTDTRGSLGTWTIATGTAVDFRKLSGSQYQALQNALISAYPRPNDLQAFVKFYLGQTLAVITNAGSLQADVFNLIQWTQARGSTEKLFRSALLDNPGNPDLVAFSARVGAPGSTQQVEEVGASKLQRKVRDNVPTFDLPTFLGQLGTAQRRVCRVEVGGAALGTGFLVGNAAVMTNYHVLESVITGKVSATKVVLRFDYATGNSGTTFSLEDEDWLIDSAPYAAFEVASPGGGTPAAGELDYAIVRVQGAPGQEGLRAREGDVAPRTRGFFALPEGAANALMNNDPLYVVQHPKGAPVKVAIDTQAVLGYNDNNTRVRHAVNTEEGSSGSPVFTFDHTLTALHHAGDTSVVPPFNQAVPIGAIRAQLVARGKLAALSE